MSHLHLSVVWAGQGSPVLFCLGRDIVSHLYTIKFIKQFFQLEHFSGLEAWGIIESFQVRKSWHFL